MNVDLKTIKARYIYPGNLKIALADIENLEYSEKQINNLANELKFLKNILLSSFVFDQNDCYKVDLSLTRSLYIDYKNNQLNFFIEDKLNKVITQIITIKECEKLQRIESILSRKIKEYTSKDINTDRNKNNLASTLIHSAYKEIQHNRGSPVIFGNTIDDDFNLDL